MNLQEILELLEEYSRKNYRVIRHDKSFDPDEFYAFFEDMKKIGNAIEGFSIIVELSRRRALIAILQERFYKISCYSKENIEIDFIEQFAKTRFKFNNREKNIFNHPQVIHPKNPLKHYGDDTKSLNQFRIALEYLLYFPKIHIYDTDAVENLVQLYERVKD